MKMLFARRGKRALRDISKSFVKNTINICEPILVAFLANLEGGIHKNFPGGVPPDSPKFSARCARLRFHLAPPIENPGYAPDYLT